MRLLSNKKGQVRVIEAFFASMLIMSCLALIPAQVTPKSSAVNLDWKAQNVLLTLDSDGQLASLVDNHDWTKLGLFIESVLPLTTWFNLTIYDKNQKILNDYPISNGGSISDRICSFDYVCVSQKSAFSVYILQLQLAVMD
jgi:hypothetical protein